MPIDFIPLKLYGSKDIDAPRQKGELFMTIRSSALTGSYFRFTKVRFYAGRFERGKMGLSV